MLTASPEATVTPGPGDAAEPAAVTMRRRWRHHQATSRLVVLLILLGCIVLIDVASAGHRRSTLAGAGLVALLLVVLIVLRSEFDSTTLLLTATSASLLLPSRLVFAPLGGAGTPAMVLGLLGGGLWLFGVLVPALGSARGRQPVRALVLLYLLAVIASFVVASQRGLDPVEARAADRGLFVAASAVGFALVAADGIRTRARLERLLKGLIVGSCGLAIIGILQFTISLDLASMIRLPLLSVDETKYEAITQRSEFNRVSGTTYHPIEFSAVLTMILPLALHFTSSSPPGQRRRWWLAVGILGAAVPMSVSRTGTIGLLAVALVLFPTWTRPRRKQAMWAALLMAIAMKALIPGLLGTIRSLFLSFGVDPSVTNRRIDYSYVNSFIAQRPVFGRGFGTFLPTRYDYLDNQFLLSLVETGVVGLVMLLGVFTAGMGCLRGLRRRSADSATRDLAQSMLAGLVVVLLTCGTFDFLSFPTARTVAFLLVGCAGALWRLERERRPEPAAAEPSILPAAAVRS